jgi:hypothetical protein
MYVLILYTLLFCALFITGLWELSVSRTWIRGHCFKDFDKCQSGQKLDTAR